MKVRALLLVILLLLAIVPVAAPSSAGSGETRSPGSLEIKLYTQMTATSTGLSTLQSTSRTRTSDNLEFASVELEEDLKVEGVFAGTGQNLGLKARIGVTAGPQATQVTVSVLDDGNSIAEKEMNIPAIETRWEWELPFLTARDTYNFYRGNVITLRIEANHNVIVRTDSDSYLGLTCVDHLAVTVDTRDVDDRRATTFYPNDLAEFRHVYITGDVMDPFGVGDVAGVNISIKRPNGQFAVENAAATVGADMNYTYDWAYVTGLASGTYIIIADGRDQQEHEFTVQGSLIMAEYGIRMSAEGEEAGVVSGSATPGNLAQYTLTILNIGGKRADVAMSDGDPQPLWSTSFSRQSFSLDPGADTDIVYKVQPSSSLGAGNTSVFKVTATVNNDPALPKAKASIQVETLVRKEVDLQVLPENPDPKKVGVGGTVNHPFTIRNKGEFSTTVDLQMTGLPGGMGWMAVLEGNRVEGSAIKDLRPGEIVDVNLKVTAPNTSDIKKVSIKVRCQSREWPDVHPERTFVTNLVIGLVLTPTTPTNTTQDPGDSFIIYFDATNNDPTAQHQIAFTVIQDSTNWPASSFRFDPLSQVTIAADSKRDMHVEVVLPATAVAGTPKFTVKGVVDGHSEVFASFVFNVKINVHHALVVDLEPEVDKFDISTKEESLVYLTISNDGNVQETLNITVEISSGNVEVKMNDALTSIIINMPVGPGQQSEIKVGFKAKDTAKNNEAITVRIAVRMASDPTPISNDFKLEVKLSSAELFIDYMDWGAIIIIMLVMMVLLLAYNPRKRRARENPEDESKKDATHGTVVRH